MYRLNDLESGQSREVYHFHYTDWPDFGVPKTPTPFLRFLRDIRCSGALDPAHGPVVVHCSAGIGRSGTFCLIDSCLIKVNNINLSDSNLYSKINYFWYLDEHTRRFKLCSYT